MRKFLLMIAALMMTLVASAQGDDAVAGVKFGTAKAAAVSQLESSFGKKSVAEGDQVAFSGISYKGFKFNQAKFYFNEEGKLNQARFYMQVANKAAAVKQMNAIEAEMSKEYKVSDDEDEDGKFVKGGLGPDGQSLFTIYTVRIQGKWNVGLRYGAFNI